MYDVSDNDDIIDRGAGGDRNLSGVRAQSGRT